jgi:hypothetical protein
MVHPAWGVEVYSGSRVTVKGDVIRKPRETLAIPVNGTHERTWKSERPVWRH